MNKMYVIKRNGEKEEVSFDKIKKRLEFLCQMTPKITNINIILLVKNVIKKLRNKIKTTELDIFSADYSNDMSIKNFNYQLLASRIIINNNHKNTMNKFSEKTKILFNGGINIFGEKKSLLNKDYFNFVKKYEDFLDNIIDYNRDYKISYFGFKTLEKSYLLKTINVNEGTNVIHTTIESPQDLFLRVAIAIHKDSIFTDDDKEKLENIKETYNYISNKYFTHASPTLYNSGCKYQQFSSCFLLGTGDSIEDIFKTLNHCSRISKYGAGIGIHISNIRSSKSLIKSIGEMSDGIIPFIQLFNYTARAVNQGKRRGSIALYLEPHHPDILDFLELKINHGLPEKRARDLSYALWISDYFMECVEYDLDWYFLDPSYCPKLNEVYGKEYKNLCIKYIKEKRYSGKIKARKIWEKIWVSQRETGYPYICYKDIINKTSNQKYIGTIKSSNLCVAPETLILTDKGHIKIKDLCNKKVKVWNGLEFSETIVRQTGSNQKLIKIEFSDGAHLECTPYHKFYIQEKNIRKSFIKKDIINHKFIKIIEAQNLNIGMKLIKCKYPVINNNKKLKDAYTNGIFSGDGSYRNNLNILPSPCKFKYLSNKLFCDKHLNYDVNKINKDANNNICKAYEYTKYPYIDLYGENIKLLKYLSYISHRKWHDNKLSVKLVQDLKDKFFVPLEYSLESKLKWFAGYCDVNGTIANNNTNKSLQISSIDKNFLIKIKYMLQTCGINPKVTKSFDTRYALLPNEKEPKSLYKSLDLWRLFISSLDLYKLYELGFNCNCLQIIPTIIPNRIENHFIKITKIMDNNRIDDTYCFNENKRHIGIFNGIITSQCTEIMQHSNANDHSVCTLASICLPKFVILNNKKKNFDFQLLFDTIGIIVKNLNIILQINNYPTKESFSNSTNYKSIGIGVQGLHDVYLMLRYEFGSIESQKLNKLIFETIYYASLWHSNKLCIKLKKRTNKDASYKGFKNSPLGKGIFHWELFNKHTIHNFKVSDLWDWEKLRFNIKKDGLLNSLCVALMPTASTSQIMGNSEAFEPYTSNIYKRKTSAGEFIVINKFLAQDLQKAGIYNKNIINQIIINGGSIANIKEIHPKLKALYKTVWEISFNDILKQAVVRQAFVDQSQSLNIYVENLTYSVFNRIHFTGYKNGLKTGCYYMRTKPKVEAQKFTIEPKINSNPQPQVICDGDICTSCAS